MEAARKQGDLEKIGKIQKVVQVVQEATKEPPEIALIEELLDAPDEGARHKLLEAHRQDITPELLDTMTNILAQTENSQEKELSDQLKAVHRQLLRFSMEMKFKG